MQNELSETDTTERNFLFSESGLIQENRTKPLFQRAAFWSIASDDQKAARGLKKAITASKQARTGT